VGLEEEKQPTIALGYLMRDREKSGIVAPKWYDYGDLVGYVSIVAKEVQNLEDLRGGNLEETVFKLGNL
jgi:23S rRNA maturation-related 3'-5' exoribonuclease YhaM